MIKEIYQVLEQIKKTSSRNEKEEIISIYKDNELIRTSFNFLFNDFITTGLDVKKLNKRFKEVHTVRGFNSILDVYGYLQANNTGRDSVILAVQLFIKDNADSKEEEEFLKQLFTKTYKVGCTAKTINKAFDENFIPEFNVQLAHPFDKFSDRVVGDFVLTTKLDGNRILAVVDEEGSATFFTRTGKPIEGLGEISKELRELAQESILTQSVFNKGFVLDGEILIKDDSKYEDKFAETMKIVRKNGDKTDLVFWTFDILPLSEFYEGESKAKYFERESMLSLIFNEKERGFVERLTPLYKGNDLSVIPNYLQEVIDLGEEGLMLNSDTTYKCKRNPGLLKIKTFYTSDVLVKGYFEGEGALKGTLGGLIIDWKGFDVKVGSGFSLEQRNEIWSNLGAEETIVGKIIEIQFFEESKNQKNDDISLRFPTFKQFKFKTIRDDKSVEDVNYEC